MTVWANDALTGDPLGESRPAVVIARSCPATDLVDTTDDTAGMMIIPGNRVDNC